MILFYPKNDTHGQRLENAVVTIIPKETIVVFHEREKLLEYLRKLTSKHRVLLFQAVSKDQLLEMLRNNELLDNLKKILVLPDNSSTVIQAACTLYPSNITNVISNFDDVQDVLIKIKSRIPQL
jgi:Mg/Co/Ni transporter MgtE